MELASRVRQPVCLTPGPKEQLLGNVHLRVRRDASVCKMIAEEGYDEDLGARSLITAVRAVVEECLVESYLDVEQEITEAQGKTKYLVDINRGEVEVRMVNGAEDEGYEDGQNDLESED